MSKQDYWDEAVRVAFNDWDVVATEEQILGVAGVMDGAHENIDMAYPSGPPDRPSKSPELIELEKLREQVRLDGFRVRCEWCKGLGSEVEDCHGRRVGCDMCDGSGRVVAK